MSKTSHAKHEHKAAEVHHPEAERRGNVSYGLELVADDFRVTEISLGNKSEQRFSAFTADEARKVIGKVYNVTGCEY